MFRLGGSGSGPLKDFAYSALLARYSSVTDTSIPFGCVWLVGLYYELATGRLIVREDQRPKYTTRNLSTYGRCANAW